VTPEALGAGQLAFVAVVMLAAGLVHGALGFGFPLIATPLVGLVIDIKTAILLVAPVTLVVTVLSVVRGGGWRQALAHHWILPPTMAVGVYAGTWLLIVAKPAPFLLVLAVLIFVYLGLDKLRRGESAFVKRWQLPIGLGAGLAAGVFEATANVAVPPLIIYLSPRCLAACASATASTRRPTANGCAARCGSWRCCLPGSTLTWNFSAPEPAGQRPRPGAGEPASIRKLPRQVDRSEVEVVFDSISARKRAGGMLPSASCGLSSL
jgi:hypothetical protein